MRPQPLPAGAPSTTADSDVPPPHRLLRRRPYRTKSAPFDFPLVARFLRRSRLIRLLLVLPLFYVANLFMCLGKFSLSFSYARSPPLPGSVYRSDIVFARVWPEMQADAALNSSSSHLKGVLDCIKKYYTSSSTLLVLTDFTLFPGALISSLLSTIWRYGISLEEAKPCLSATVKRSRTYAPTGYLVVEANGGLNQQRSSICNAVAVARLLNAALVIPKFQFNSIWKDPSKFSDIYDEDRFIRILDKYVHIVKKIPDALMKRFDYNVSNIPILKIEAWTSAAYYATEVYAVLNRRKVIRIAPFANRLAINLPPSIQVLRCITNYEALRFSDTIGVLGSKLITRMRKRSFAVGGKYISIHLRFEEQDMVAFSCCEYGGGDEEKREMERARQIGWGGKFTQEGRMITPDIYRINGRCPLTPLEVGMMLRGMGFDNTTSIYLASGKIYRAEKTLAPLLQMFPFLYTKESLTTSEELASFEGYSSRLAALDYTVCLHSEVFVTTQGGNFPQFLEGHRRYLNNGHAKTIKPDKRTLVKVLHNTSISWKDFKDQMQPMLTDNVKKGVSARKEGQSIYAYPSPECICTSHPPTT